VLYLFKACYTFFNILYKALVENPVYKCYYEDLGVDGKVTLKLTLKIEWEFVDSTHQAQDRNVCRAFVDTVVNLRGPQDAGNILSSCGTLRF
jgi:hypothetical protein